MGYEAGKISYMRTDSVNLSDDAVASAKNAIESFLKNGPKAIVEEVDENMKAPAKPTVKKAVAKKPIAKKAPAKKAPAKKAEAIPAL